MTNDPTKNESSQVDPSKLDEVKDEDVNEEEPKTQEDQFAETIVFDSKQISPPPAVVNEKKDSVPPEDSGKPAGEAPEMFGRYEVRSKIGEGGFGAVYEGFDPQLNRRVAIKTLHANAKGGKVDQQAFLQEARQLAQLSHPNIVTVYDVGLHEGRCYIVSDFLEGDDLSKWLRSNQPSWERSASIVADLADALSHAHSNRIVHRDVKPENVILKDGKTPVLVDFGLALSDADSVEDERGKIAGTPHYMSPEQASGRAHRIDGRTDVYALGVVLYRMLVGRTPFHAPDMREVLRQVRDDLPQPPRQLIMELPVELEDICLKAMAKRPSERYTTALDMANELRAFLEKQTDSVIPTQAFDEPLPDEQIPTEQLPTSVRKAREAERRQVTVVYCECNVFESMEFLENLDPDEQHELLTEYRDLCQRSVSQFGGTVVQSTGSSLLVCYGYPMAYEDSARRAVLTGQGIMDGIGDLNRQFADAEIELAPWIAIHTGVVVAKETLDDFSPEPMSIVGEARSVATQLKITAIPGSVIVSQATQKIIQGYFESESLGFHSIPGASKPVEAFKILGETSAQSRIDVTAESLTPLIGRDMEVGILSQRWEQAAEGMGQVVLLIGDAGLGKSRLVHEIRSRVLDDNEPGQVVEWRCTPYHQTSSFHPAIEFFERQTEIQHSDSPAEKLNKLVKHLAEQEMDDNETVALLAQLLSIPLDDRFQPLTLGPQRLKEMTQHVILDWLREYSSREPVLFIIEDLHWLDPTTLEFITMLVEEGANDCLMSLLTFRPEFSTPWTSMAHQTQVALNRLTKKQVGEMIQAKTGASNLEESLIGQLVERTDGVPLFVEEFTNVIQESDQLVEKDGKIELIENFSLDAIPSTLQDLLASRLDRMESAHEVVQLGATIGREFSRELIEAVFDDEETDLDEELEKLVKSELLVQRGRGSRTKYSFKHALIQDAAYQSLLKKKRQHFHKNIAAAIEEKFADTLQTEPEIVAFHFTEGGLGDKAIPLWLAAGQRSQSRSAVAEAISHFTAGLKLIEKLDDGPEKIQLELGFQLPLGMSLVHAKGYATNEVGATFRRARELCEQLGPGSPLFYVLWGLWVWHLVRNELHDCLPYAEEIMKLAEATGDEGFIMEACFTMGCTKFYLAEYDEARAILERGLPLYNEERCKGHAQYTGQDCGTGTLIYLALTLWHMGYPEQALKRGEEALELGAKINHPFTHAFVMYHFGWVLHYLRLGDRIEQLGKDGEKLSFDQGFALWQALSILNQGAGPLLQNSASDVGEAFERIYGGFDAYQMTGANLHCVHCYGVFAALHLEAGEFDKAAEQLEKGFKMAIECSEFCDEPELNRLQGEYILAKTSDEAEAERWFQKSLEIARSRNAKSWELRTTASLARMRDRQGKRDEARTALAEILGWFTEGQDSHDLVAAKKLLDELS